MGLDDIIFDSIYGMLDALSHYDYYTEARNDIIEVIASHLKVADRLACLEPNLEELEKINYLEMAVNLCDSYVEENIDDEESEEDKE